MTFTRAPHRHETMLRETTLAERTWLSPDYVRLRVRGEDLRGFAAPGEDDHVRLFFPDDDQGPLREGASRQYTPLRWDAEEGWLELEFLVHGTEGVAGRWAANAPIGSRVGVAGPRGSRVLEGTPDAWLLVGDETAVPAIRRFIAAMPADAVGRVIIEVQDTDHELDLEVPGGVTLTWTHRSDAPSSSLVTAMAAMTADDRPAGQVFAFIAAEQSIVKPGRELVLERWNLDPEQVVIKGYWKLGEVDVD